MALNSPRISFLYADGCPLAPRARINLVQAIQKLQSCMMISFEEVDLLGARAPQQLKRWGSPTILINGKDMIGASQGDASSCRIYAGRGGVPSTLEIIEAIDSRARQ